MWTETSPHKFKTKIRRKGKSRPERGENLSTYESTIYTENIKLKKNYTMFSNNICFFINNSYCPTK